MKLYPFTSPIILNDTIFIDYGGNIAGTSAQQRQSLYQEAEIQVSNYIGTLLRPTMVSGTYGYMSKQRIVTEYGYVSQLISIDILSQNIFSSSCSLISQSGCGFIWEDTFGYIDVRQVFSVNNLPFFSFGLAPLFPLFTPLMDINNPYQFNINYVAGVPTGTSMQPPVLHALTIMAQINQNEMFPGLVGLNEGVGDVGILEYQDGGMRGYREKRTNSGIKQTILGASPRANYAARLLDSVIRKARPSLRA
jgi:hypothetical protein